MSLIALAALLAMQAGSARKDVPIQLPEGWESERTEGALVVRPKGVPAATYSIMFLDLTTKVGTAKDLLDVGREQLKAIAPFKSLAKPARTKTDGGWDCEFELGTVEQEGLFLIVLAMGLDKQDDEAVLILMADTMETYKAHEDGFAHLVKSFGAPKRAAPTVTAKGTKDLKYGLPDGWTARDQETTVLLQKKEQCWWGEGTFSLVVYPAQPLTGSLSKTFHQFWSSEMKVAVETQLLALPLMRRLKSGLALAYDVDNEARNKEGKTVIAGLYMLGKGKLTVPILAFYPGVTPTFEQDLLTLLESADITGAGDGKIALFDAADVAGHWDKSSYSLASYVNVAGGYAGDASMAIASSHTLAADGSFKYSFTSVRGGGTALQIQRQGRWTIDDDWLVEKDSKDEYRNRLYGVGGDAKAGRFLVIGRTGNLLHLDLTEPRRTFSGDWYKRKD